MAEICTAIDFKTTATFHSIAVKCGGSSLSIHTTLTVLFCQSLPNHHHSTEEIRNLVSWLDWRQLEFLSLFGCCVAFEVVQWHGFCRVYWIFCKSPWLNWICIYMANNICNNNVVFAVGGSKETRVNIQFEVIISMLRNTINSNLWWKCGATLSTRSEM